MATVKKDEAAKMVVRKLEAQRSKMVEKEKEWMEELYANSQELDSQLLSKTKELERVTSSLQEITEKMVKESNNLAECRKELKMKKALSKYYSKDGMECVSAKRVDADEVAVLTEAIEKAFMLLKGKHASTKAKLLIQSIMNGNLFKGEAAAAVNDVIKQYIKNLFRPWKLVKAGDMSSVGGFKISTINALRDIVDEEGVGFFPSPSSVCRSRALLDDYGKEVVGYERRVT